jgi:hypothetical protein
MKGKEKKEIIEKALKTKEGKDAVVKAFVSVISKKIEEEVRGKLLFENNDEEIILDLKTLRKVKE